MTATPQRPVRRILVAFDAEGGESDSLEAAAEIARRLRAELVGLFVEDINLLRSAALPFVRQMRPGEPSWRDFDTGTVERELRALQARARRLLEAAAARHRLACSFRILRGQVAHELATAAEAADLLVIEDRPRPLGRHLRLGSRVRPAARKAASSVLVLRPGSLATRHLLVAYDGSPGADKALAVAARLARADRGDITVLLLSGERERLRAFEARVTEILGRDGASATIRAYGEPSIAGLCALAHEVGDSTLVINADSALVRGDGTEQLMDRVSCPLLLVR